MAHAVLVVLEQPEAAAGLLAAVARLAGLIGGAHITALGIRIPPAATILPTEEILTARQERQRWAEEAERLAVLRTAFDAWADASAPRARGGAQWRDTEGPPRPVVAEYGRRVDFLVIARPRPRDHMAERQVVHAALFDTDRPVLVVPCAQAAAGRPAADFGRVVAIAWRDDQRAVKAMLSAIAFLPVAEQVHLLAGRREGAADPAIPPIVTEHDIEATLHVMPIGPAPFGAALLARAHALGADMLVMGAYGHSPLRDLILGGVTQYMLAHADLPVLMRH